MKDDGETITWTAPIGRGTPAALLRWRAAAVDALRQVGTLRPECARTPSVPDGGPSGPCSLNPTSTICKEVPFDYPDQTVVEGTIP